MKYIKNKSEFEKEVLNHEGTILVDFFAEWCGPCKMMEPVLNAFVSNPSGVKVVKINVDEAQELAMEYNVMSIPTLYVFKGGKVVRQLVGFQNQEQLLEATK